MLFDSHAHLLDDRFDEDREAVIAAFPEKGVDFVLECATDPEDMEKAVALARDHERVFAAVGVHPHDASSYTEEVREKIRQLTRQPKVVAIGEIGLDYHYDFSPREVQRAVLEDQLALAKELDLPVSLHSRESTADMLEILKKFAPLKGVMHCFSGSVETARVLLDMGLHLGFGGTLTFKNAAKAVAVAQITPMDRILLETDSPYLAPVPFRGSRNEPARTRQVAQVLAGIKNMEMEEVARITKQNASALFGVENG